MFQLISENKKNIVPASSDNPLYQRVAGIVHRLLTSGKALAHLPNKDWTITVVDDAEHCNALVLPVIKRSNYPIQYNQLNKIPVFLRKSLNLSVWKYFCLQWNSAIM